MPLNICEQTFCGTFVGEEPLHLCRMHFAHNSVARAIVIACEGDGESLCPELSVLAVASLVVSAELFVMVPFRKRPSSVFCSSAAQLVNLSPERSLCRRCVRRHFRVELLVVLSPRSLNEELRGRRRARTVSISSSRKASRSAFRFSVLSSGQ